MKFIVLDDYYERVLGSRTEVDKRTLTLLCDCYMEAYDKYTQFVDAHIASGVKVRKEQTLRGELSYALCEFANDLSVSIQQLDHPTMETKAS